MPWNVTFADTDIKTGPHTSSRGVTITARPDVAPVPDAVAVTAAQASIDAARQKFLTDAPEAIAARNLLVSYKNTLAEAEALRRKAGQHRVDAQDALVHGRDPSSDEAAARTADAEADHLADRASRIATALEDAQLAAVRALSVRLAGVLSEHQDRVAQAHTDVVAGLRDVIASKLAEAAGHASTRTALDAARLNEALPDAIDFQAERLKKAAADLARGVAEFRALPTTARRTALDAVKRGTSGELPAALAGAPHLLRVLTGRVDPRLAAAGLPVADLSAGQEDAVALLHAIRR